MKKRMLSFGKSAAFLLLAGSLLLCGCAGPAPATTVPPTTTAPPTTTVPKTTAPKTEPTETEDVPMNIIYLDEKTGIYYDHYERPGLNSDEFELPLAGATGYAPIPMTVLAEPDGEETEWVLLPGEAFVILEEKNDIWWRITKDDAREGWVKNTYCYLNLPDVIPSIVYDNTNGYSSIFVSSGRAVPNIYGEKLYDSKFRNERLDKDEYVMACNYRMAKNVFAAQQAALAEGYTLVINETFRPMDVQKDVAAGLQLLYNQDNVVRAGINVRPWGIGWFIANGLSTHQMGCAMDVSLARVVRMEMRVSGPYRYAAVTEMIPCQMPTPMHELSAAAVSLSQAVNGYSKTAWKAVQPAASMTKDAMKLQEICTGAGNMHPLASEWWHFNDLDAKDAIGDHYITDVFRLEPNLTRIPK